MAEPRITGTYNGQVLFIMFETSTDLQAMMPKGLTVEHPNRAFIKAERIKMSVPGRQDPPYFTQYRQICITTMAGPVSDVPRHRNLLMWEDRHWAIGSSMAAQKRYGNIELSQVFDNERPFIDESHPVPYFVDVQDSGFPLMRFKGILDGKQTCDVPPYNGFYISGEDGGEPLAKLSLADAAITRPIWGHGELSFGAAPNENPSAPLAGKAVWPATVFKDVRVRGCVLYDLMFKRTYGAEYSPVKVV